MCFSCCSVQAVLAGASSSREGTLCCQAVFTLLDTLQRWHADAKAAAQALQKQQQSGQPQQGDAGAEVVGRGSGRVQLLKAALPTRAFGCPVLP